MVIIDLEKACNHVEWDCVDYMLLRFGFDNWWRRWLRECISTTSFSASVNGSPSRLLKASRGIRQGVLSLPSFSLFWQRPWVLFLSKLMILGLFGVFSGGHGGEAIMHL